MIYRKLASIRTSIYVLSVMALLFMVGTVFPQGGKLDDYAAAGGRFVALVRFLHLLDFYSSPLFLAAAFVLFANLAVCTFERFFRLRDKAREQHIAPTHSLALTQGETDARAETRRILADELGFKAVSSGGGWTVAEKGLPCAWLTWLYHAGLIVCIIGAALTYLFAFEGSVTLTPGKPAVFEPTERGRLTFPGSSRPDFTLTAGELQTEYAETPKLNYPDDPASRLAVGLGWGRPAYHLDDDSLSPVGWTLRLRVGGEGHILRDKTISVNDPLKYSGFTFYFDDFDQIFKVRVNDNPLILEAKNSEELTVPGLDFPVRFTAFRRGMIKKLDGTAEVISGYTNLQKSGEGPSNGEYLGRIEPGQSMYINGLKLTLLSVVQAPVITYRSDPGVAPLWVGGILVLAAMSLRFFGYWYRVAYRVETRGGIAHLEMNVKTKGLFADGDRLAGRMEHYLTKDEILLLPLKD